MTCVRIYFLIELRQRDVFFRSDDTDDFMFAFRVNVPGVLVVCVVTRCSDWNGDAPGREGKTFPRMTSDDI